MYNRAEKTINAGLSAPARYILAFFSALFGVVMLLGASLVDKPAFYYVFAGYCFLIAGICLVKGRLRKFLGSCIGLSLFCIACAYIVQEVLTGPVISTDRATPSVLGSIGFASAFGIPGLVYVWKVGFGFRQG